MKKKVLFICVHNSARSQMAEAYLKALGGNGYEVESAGFEPSTINPLVVKAMMEDGIDISDNTTQSVYDLLKAGRFFGYIVTVCDRAREKECPTFPGVAKKIHWELEDPEGFTGTEEEKMDKIRDLRDRIKVHVLSFIEYDK